MNTPTIIVAAVIIAATAALAIAPLATVMALSNGDSITVKSCTHNGNGRTTDGACSGKGNSAQTNTQILYKCQGKFTTTPC